MIQTPLLFGDEKEGALPCRKIVRPGPLVKKSVVILHPIDRELPYRTECERIFNATHNRMFMPSGNEMEMKIISEHLVKAFEKIGGSLDDLIARVEKMLQSKTNLYSNQAIIFVEGMKKS